jgi:hypothetical protein
VFAASRIKIIMNIKYILVISTSLFLELLLFAFTTFLPVPKVIPSITNSPSTKIKAATIHCKNRPSPNTRKLFKNAGVTHIVLVPKATILKVTFLELPGT